jgi:hypothetical protein
LSKSRPLLSPSAVPKSATKQVTASHPGPIAQYRRQILNADKEPIRSRLRNPTVASDAPVSASSASQIEPALGHPRKPRDVIGQGSLLDFK